MLNSLLLFFFAILEVAIVNKDTPLEYQKNQVIRCVGLEQHRTGVAGSNQTLKHSPWSHLSQFTPGQADLG